MSSEPAVDDGPEVPVRRFRINWRWAAAILLYGAGLGGMLMGVGLSERPDDGESGLLTKAYYALGLFVVGGLDLGVPSGGPALGRLLLWLAYFGCPLLMASAVIEAVLRVMRPGRWQLRRLSDHVIIIGSGELTTSYLRMLRGHLTRTPIVVVDDAVEPVREEELTQRFGVTVVSGDITHRFLQHELRLHKVRQLVFLGDNDFQAYEAASKVLNEFPHSAPVSSCTATTCVSCVPCRTRQWPGSARPSTPTIWRLRRWCATTCSASSGKPSSGIW